MHPLQQGPVSLSKQGYIGHGQSSQRFPVVTAADTHKFLLLGQPRVSPIVHAHFERNFDRRGAV